MENRKNIKYFILIALFTIIFFTCMAVCFVRYRALASEYKTRSVSYRLDCVKLEEDMFGPAEIFNTIYFDYDYEAVFDSYWEFADIYHAYIRGRFSDDKAPYIEKLNAYLASSDNDSRKTAVSKYLEALTQ